MNQTQISTNSYKMTLLLIKVMYIHINLCYNLIKPFQPKALKTGIPKFEFNAYYVIVSQEQEDFASFIGNKRTHIWDKKKRK